MSANKESAKIISGCLVVLCIIELLLLLIAGLRLWFAEGYVSLTYGIYAGMSRDELIEKLGQPRQVFHSLDEMRDVHYYPLPRLEVSHEVYFYEKLPTAGAFIYLDEAGRVTGVFLVAT